MYLHKCAFSIPGIKYLKLFDKHFNEVYNEYMKQNNKQAQMSKGGEVQMNKWTNIQITESSIEAIEDSIADLELDEIRHAIKIDGYLNGKRVS